MVKGGKKSPKIVQKSSRPSQTCIETRRLHAAHFQARPLTAHFHRLKRRFDSFLKAKQVFYRRKKGLVFAQFCIFSVNFRRSLHIFAFSCIILLTFAVNFPKHHKKPQNDHKNGPKMGKNGPKWSQNSPKRGQKRPQKGPKRPQNDAKTMPK